MSKELVRIWSGEWDAWWRPEGAGYTLDALEAGVWTREEAERKTSHCGAEKKIRLVAVEAPGCLECSWMGDKVYKYCDRCFAMLPAGEQELLRIVRSGTRLDPPA